MSLKKRSALAMVSAALLTLNLVGAALANHLPAYSLPAASCNAGTERAQANANQNSYGSRPMNEGTAAGCHHHHPAP